jgi:hypothetical protein
MGTATAEARIADSKGRLLAHATTTCLVFEIPTGTAGTWAADIGCFSA